MNNQDPSQTDGNTGNHAARPNNTESETEMNTAILLLPEDFDQPLYVDPRTMEYDPQFTGQSPEVSDRWTTKEGDVSPSNSSMSHQELTPPAGEGPSIPRPKNYRFYNDIPSADNWEAVKPLLEEMYMKKGMTQQEVARVMEKDYHFFASERSYKYRFQKWNWFKNKPKSRKERN